MQWLKNKFKLVCKYTKNKLQTICKWLKVNFKVVCKCTKNNLIAPLASILKWLKDKILTWFKDKTFTELILILALIGVVALMVWVFLGCSLNFGIFKNPSSATDSTNIKDSFDILRNLALGIGGMLALAYTSKRLKQTDKQIEQTNEQIQLNQKNNLSNTYKNAVELLANSKESVRIAGVEILQKIATDNNNYKKQIITILSKHVVDTSKQDFNQLIKSYNQANNITDFNAQDYASLQKLRDYAKKINWVMPADIQHTLDILFTLSVVSKTDLEILHGDDNDQKYKIFNSLACINLSGARFTSDVLFNAPENINLRDSDKYLYYKWNIENIIFLRKHNLFGCPDFKFLVWGNEAFQPKDYNTVFLDGFDYNQNQYCYTEYRASDNRNKVVKYVPVYEITDITDNKETADEVYYCIFSKGWLFLIKEQSIFSKDCQQAFIFYNKTDFSVRWHNFKIVLYAYDYGSVKLLYFYDKSGKYDESGKCEIEADFIPDGVNLFKLSLSTELEKYKNYDNTKTNTNPLAKK